MNDVLLVLTTAPDQATAERIAEALVHARAAACVNVLAGCHSVYHWQGTLERAAEVPLLIKTKASAYPRLEAELRKLHPYALPEIIAVPVVQGLPAYLDWVAAETRN